MTTTLILALTMLSLAQLGVLTLLWRRLNALAIPVTPKTEALPTDIFLGALQKLDTRIDGLETRQRKLPTQAPDAAPADRSYLLAQRLAKQGATVQQIASPARRNCYSACMPVPVTERRNPDARRRSAAAGLGAGDGGVDAAEDGGQDDIEFVGHIVAHAHRAEYGCHLRVDIGCQAVGVGAGQQDIELVGIEFARRGVARGAGQFQRDLAAWRWQGLGHAVASRNTALRWLGACGKPCTIDR
jgi:hypothetical protein